MRSFSFQNLPLLPPKALGALSVAGTATGIPSRHRLAAIERKFRAEFRDKALHELRDCEPQFSAATTITSAQIRVVVILCVALTASFIAAPRFAGTTLVAVLAVSLVATLMFRVVLMAAGYGNAWRPPTASPVPDTDLPTYTILVPLYREANVMPQLIAALCAIDYPAHRLDVKLVVEEDDTETAMAAKVAARDPRFSVIRVPYDEPRTKPRACNYALPFAMGEFTVIFDAEDRPEPDQLRKAVAAFRAAPENVACLQARLDFFNANECWLTNGVLALREKAAERLDF